MIEGFMLLMNTADDFTGPVNLDIPSEFTILELAERVIDMMGSRSELVFQPLPQDDARQSRNDILMAKYQKSWELKVNLEEGLVHTIAYSVSLLKEAT